ncbi:NADPH-dependent F420 reductase [Archaeoglobus neptunius]|uniref:NADPH-dependent F420 reductase n=1 Tax=Archaeoglobus neptunius TaxID=2798580 RepID=UPI0019268988|nr:NADPH-dependent F420 reductase [Archaeoglobus neptunius]
MRIALLGGTGNLGKGLAVRLSRLGYEVIVGSRKDEKAKRLAEEYSSIAGVEIQGFENRMAAKMCDVAVVTIPWEYAFSTAESLKEELKGKVVVSPLVPMKRENGVFTYVRLAEGSAAEKLASLLESKVVSAFHSVPAARFADLNEKIDWDLVICGDEEGKKIVKEISEKMGFRVFDAGPLSASYLLESLVPLVLNIMARNRTGELTIRFV